MENLTNKKLICIACGDVAEGITTFQDHCIFGHNGCDGAEIYDATMMETLKAEQAFKKARFAFYG